MTRTRGALIGLTVSLSLTMTVAAIVGLCGDLVPFHGGSELDRLLASMLFLPFFLAIPAAFLGAAIGATLARGPRGLQIGPIMGLIAAIAFVAAWLKEIWPR